MYKSKKAIKNKILFSGGMILEVVLMVAIVMMIYPLINEQTIKRKTKLRDILIVKEINTIRQVFERFLLKYVESFPKNTTCNIDLATLKSECKSGKVIPPVEFNNEHAFLNKVYDMGLPAGVGKGTNMLGQKYSVRVRRKSLENSNVDLVEAIVVASGEVVEDITIRSIVKELGFSGGYVENNSIVGMNWFNSSKWDFSKDEDSSNSGKFDDSTLINRLNPVKADKSLLVKYKTTNIADNTMQADILMNNNDLKRVNTIDVKSGQYTRLIASNINIDTSNQVDFQIDQTIQVKDINYDKIDFDLGFTANSAILTINGVGDNLKFARDLKVDNLNVLGIPGGVFVPVKLTELKVRNIETDNRNLTLQVNGRLNATKLTIESKDDKNDVLKVNSLYTSKLGIGDNVGSEPRVKYKYIKAIVDLKKKPDLNNSIGEKECNDCVLYIAKDGTFNGKLSKFKDLVVSELNKKIDGVLIGKFRDKRNNNTQTYDGVIVRYDTTLGEILISLERERKMIDYYIDTYFDDNWGGF